MYPEAWKSLQDVTSQLIYVCIQSTYSVLYQRRSFISTEWLALRGGISARTLACDQYSTVLLIKKIPYPSYLCGWSSTVPLEIQTHERGRRTTWYSGEGIPPSPRGT